MACVNCNINALNVVEEVGLQEEGAIQYFQRHGVLTTRMTCPTCGGNATRRPNTLYFRCQRVRHLEGGRVICNFKKSIKTDSWLARTHLSFIKLLQFIAAWLTIPHPRHKFLVESLGMSKSVVVEWSNLFREICVGSLELSDVDIVGGHGVTVEVDEAKFSTSKYHRERHVEGLWVFGAFETETKRCFFETVPDCSGDTLLGIILRRIAPGTTIMHDLREGYRNIRALPQYQHLTVNHSINFVDPASGARTQNVEKMWRDVRGNTPRYGTNKNDNAGCLAEFYWKRQYSINDRMHHFLLEIARQFPPNAI